MTFTLQLANAHENALLVVVIEETELDQVVTVVLHRVVIALKLSLD